MKTVAAVYTAQAIVESVSELIAEELPDVRLINIVDSGLIQDIIKDGGVTVSSSRRLLHCFMTAVDAGADAIFNTCSSVGDVVSHAQWFVPIDIIKIDDAMAEQAVAAGKRIGVLATLPTTLAPTVRLIQSHAEQSGAQVSVVEGLAEGAFEALTTGNPERHDELLRETAIRAAKDVDVIALAQGSMARMADELNEITGIPVFSSPRSGVAALKTHLNAS